MQRGDAIVLRYGYMDLVRTIHLNAVHPQTLVPSLAGHSVGRWDGNVLEVDTVGFAPGVLNPPIMNSEQLHVVERFTPVDKDTIRYEFTVEDPTTWTAPWSGEMEIRRTGDPIYEYACHEGNLGLANILRALQLSRK